MLYYLYVHYIIYFMRAALTVIPSYKCLLTHPVKARTLSHLSFSSDKSFTIGQQRHLSTLRGKQGCIGKVMFALGWWSEGEFHC